MGGGGEKREGRRGEKSVSSLPNFDLETQHSSSSRLSFSRQHSTPTSSRLLRHHHLKVVCSNTPHPPSYISSLPFPRPSPPIFFHHQEDHRKNNLIRPKQCFSLYPFVDNNLDVFFLLRATCCFFRKIKLLRVLDNGERGRKAIPPCVFPSFPLPMRHRPTDANQEWNGRTFGGEKGGGGGL